VNDNAYSRLIGDFVNDAKRNVEDAYNWNSLSDTLSAVTADGVFNYILQGSGQRFRVIDVLNDSSDLELRNASTRWMNQQFLLNPTQQGTPQYYNFNGVDSSGDTQVDLFPIPDGIYNVRFNVILPQPIMESDATVLQVPYEPVIFLAYAKALAERGEDGGLASSEAYGLYKTSLADAIALESGRYFEEETWSAT
jgi:hypothetical protein